MYSKDLNCMVLKRLWAVVMGERETGKDVSSARSPQQDCTLDGELRTIVYFHNHYSLKKKRKV